MIATQSTSKSKTPASLRSNSCLAVASRRSIAAVLAALSAAAIAAASINSVVWRAAASVASFLNSVTAKSASRTWI